MNKKLLALALATASVAAAPAAFAQDSTDGQVAATNDLNLNVPQNNSKPGAFVDLGLGVSRKAGGQVRNDKLSRAYAGSLSGGYRFSLSPDLAIGPELGYVYLGRQQARAGAKANYQANGGPGNGDTKLRGFTIGPNMRLNLTSAWYLNLRGGAFFATGSGPSNSYDNAVRRTFHNNPGYYIGAGTGWDIDKHWGVGFMGNYYEVTRKPSETNGQWNGTRFKGNSLVLTLTGEYRF